MKHMPFTSVKGNIQKVDSHKPTIMHTIQSSKPSTLLVIAILLSMFMRSNASVQSIWLTLTNPEDQYDEAVIAFKAEATDSFDTQYDYPKQRGMSDVSLYSRIDTGTFELQTMSLLMCDKTVLLGIDALIAGNYRLRLERTENMDVSSVIVIEDLVSGTFHNLRKDRDYWFHLDSAVGITRFKIHCFPALEVIAVDGKCDGTESLLQISQAGSYSWDYEIRNRFNTVIDAGTSWNGAKALAGLPTGDYTISLMDAYGYALKKDASIEDVESVVARFQVSDSVAPINQPLYFFDYSIGASNYFWDFGDGDVLSGTPFPQKAFSVPGTYRVRFTAANTECNDVSEKIIEVVDAATGIIGYSGNQPDIYSAGNEIFFDFSKSLGIAQIEIFNLTGQSIHQQILPAPGKHAVFMADHNGFLFVRALINGKSYTAKVLLQ